MCRPEVRIIEGEMRGVLGGGGGMEVAGVTSSFSEDRFISMD